MNVRDLAHRDDALRRQAQRNALLAEFLSIAAESADEREVLEHLAVGTVRATRAACLIYRATPDRTELEVVAVAADSRNEEERLRAMFAAQPWRTGEGIAGVAYASDTGIVRDLSSQEQRESYLRSLPDDRRAAMARLDLRAMVAIPIHVEGRVAGVLGLARFGRRARSFEPSDVTFVEQLAAAAGLVLSRLSLIARRELEAREAQVLFEFVESAVRAEDESEVLEQLAQRSSEAVSGSVAVYRLDGSELETVALRSHDHVADRFREMYARRRWRADEGFMGMAIATARPVFRPYLGAEDRAAYLASLPDDRRPEMAARDLRAIIVVPLSEAGRVVGVLTLARYGPAAEPLTDRERSFTEELAGRASVALSRLRLHAARTREERQKRLLAEFLAAALQATNERAVFDELAGRSADALAAACIVYRVDGEELDALAIAGYAGVAADELRSLFGLRRWRVGEGVAGAAFATGEILVRHYETEAQRREYLEALPPDHRQAMARLDMRAVIGVPLYANGTRIGSLTLSRWGASAQPFDESDTAFTLDLADRASVAFGRLALLAERERTAHVLQAVFDASPLASYLLDSERRVVMWNPAAERLFGFQAGEVVGHPSPIVPAGETDSGGFAERVAAGETVSGMPAVRLRKDGSRIEVEVYGAPIPDERGIGLLGIYADVTERNRLQREIERTSATLAGILDASPLGIIASDAQRRITYWNRAAAELFGWSAEEVIGRHPPQLIPGETDPFMSDLPRILAGETVTHENVRRRTKSGQIVELRVFAGPLRGSGDEVVGMLGLYEDVRELRQLQEHLRETSETLSAILESSPLPVIAVDEQMRVTFWNAAAERLYGWQADEVVGAIAPFTPDDDPLSQERLFARVLAHESVETEIRCKARDGRVLDIHAHSSPLYDAQGAIRGGLSVHEDVTERKRLEAELLQAQKMEVVGRLAGGVAHDFNNILTAIIGYADLAASLTSEPEARHALATIKSSGQRAAGLTQQLLAFSRRQMLQPTIVDANDVVLGMESMLRRIIGEDIELIASVGDRAGSVLVDRTQLEQVILNLAVNARDAMPDGGRLAIHTERARIHGDHPHLEMPSGDYVVISVADTGIGMDDATRGQIFEPFFTTKEVGKGTGLGLATAYGIVRQSGGYIWVYSEPGRGTTFKLYFPRVGGEQAKADEPRETPVQHRGHVLLVEDEPTLRELARIVLVRAGLDVSTASDPDEAMTAADEMRTIDLLLTDVVMPGSTGVELATRLRERDPDLRVVFMSGYAEDLLSGTRGPRTSFVAKPFTPQTLRRAVDEALGDSAPAEGGQV